MWLRLIVTLTCLFISAPSFAHGTDQHVLGTIMAINATHVEIKTSKGRSVDVRVNKKTQYKDANNPKGANVPEVGDRVIIKATKDNKVLLATEIHFSAAKRVPVPMQPVPVQ
jgi:flagellar hook assembly protein FlgD